MDISILGTVMHDEIVTLDGQRRESFGGILYNALAIATLVRPSDRVRPVCQIGDEHFALLREQFFRRFPQIATEDIEVSTVGTDSNRLVYRTASARDEVMTIRSRPLEPSRLARAVHSQAVVVNFINGQEVSLEVLRWLRGHANGLIHLDVHNLGRRRDAQGRPVPSALPEWRDWLANVDTVQLNEWEAEVLFGTRPQTPEDGEAIVREMLSVESLRAAVLTMGGAGAVMAHRRVDGQIRIVRVPAIASMKIVDTTGCGDCFSAGFVVGWLRRRNFAYAAVLASTVSNLNCEQFGLEGVTQIANVNETMREHYGSLLEKIEKGWDGR